MTPQERTLSQRVIALGREVVERRRVLRTMDGERVEAREALAEAERDLASATHALQSAAMAESTR